MSDSEFWGTVLVVCLLAWCAIAITIGAVWAVIAHRPDPWERLADQMRTARDDGARPSQPPQRSTTWNVDSWVSTTSKGRA